MKIFFVLVLLAISIIANARQPEESKKFDKELSKFYGVENISKTKIEELSTKDDIVYIIDDNNKELNIVVLTSAMGRHDWFDFFIIYNSKLEIQYMQVLVYRSDYGAEITAKRWLSQFYNKHNDSLKYGTDIQAVSGATFSAVALVKNVNRINKKLNEYYSD